MMDLPHHESERCSYPDLLLSDFLSVPDDDSSYYLPITVTITFPIPPNTFSPTPTTTHITKLTLTPLKQPNTTTQYNLVFKVPYTARYTRSQNGNRSENSR